MRRTRKISGTFAAHCIVTSAAGVAIMVISGCAVGPDFHKPTPEAPPDWSAWHGGDPALSAAELTLSNALPADRWAAFADPELTHLLARAREENLDIKVAMLRWAEARVQESAIAGQGGIQVNVSASATRRRDSEYGAAARIVDVIGVKNSSDILRALGEPYSLYQPGFDATWELDLWGRVRRSVEVAQASTEERASLLRQAQLDVMAEVARNYFGMRSSQRQLELVQGEVALAEDEERLLTAQYRGGLIDESQVIREREQIADLRAIIPTLKSQVAQGINQITRLVGLPPGSLNAELMVPPAASPGAGLPDLQRGLPSELAHHRPDIAAAEARLHSATAGIGVAVADLYPRITLGASFGLESVGTGPLSNWGARNWSVGPSISLPVFDHGQRTSTVTLRKVQEQEAAIAYQQTVLGAWHDVDDAVSGYTAARQHAVELAHKVADDENQALLAAARTTHGTTSHVPGLEARAVVSRAKRDWEMAAGQTNIALVAIIKALGDQGEVPGEAPAVVTPNIGMQ